MDVDGPPASDSSASHRAQICRVAVLKCEKISPCSEANWHFCTSSSEDPRALKRADARSVRSYYIHRSGGIWKNTSAKSRRPKDSPAPISGGGIPTNLRRDVKSNMDEEVHVDIARDAGGPQAIVVNVSNWVVANISIQIRPLQKLRIK